MDELREMGVRTVPVVARGREYVFAQALEDVSKFIGIEYRITRLPPEELVRKHLHVLAAAQRHVVQLPQDKLLQRATPGRDRSIKDLAYHVYQVGEAMLEAVEKGNPNIADFYNSLPPADVKTPQQIAAYGKSVSGRIEHWWKNLADKSCRQTVKTYYGNRPLHELLERTVWHSAQHARQIIAVLEGFGIKPNGPLMAEDYKGLPLPKGLWE
jgi:phage tail protein X